MKTKTLKRNTAGGSRLRSTPMKTMPDPEKDTQRDESLIVGLAVAALLAIAIVWDRLCAALRRVWRGE